MNTEDLTAKRDLIDHFKRIFKENEVQKAIIEEFEREYEPWNAIYWYTRPTFLFEILNKALRNSDFDVLLEFRFFITDLYKQLIDEHSRFLNSFNDNDNPILHVYRGQAISVDELHLLQESKGNFISFNNFLSTSTNPLIASVFVPANEMSINNMTAILFQFDIDTRVLKTKPYANIKHISYFPEEEEILISLGSIFRINDIKFDENTQKWIAKLSLCSEDDYELKELFTRVNTKVNVGITSLGWWLYFQGEYQRAKNFFKELLNEPSTLDDYDIANCVRGIALTCTALNEDKEAFIYFQKELEFYKKIRNYTEAGKIYIGIGAIYYRSNQFELASSCQQKAQNLLPSNHHDQSKVRQAMGTIYEEKKEFHLAEDYFNQALTIVERHYPENHVRFGEIYGNMAMMHYAKEDYERVLEYCYKQRTIYIKCRRFDHPIISYIEDYIRTIQEVLENKQVYQQNSQSDGNVDLP